MSVLHYKVIWLQCRFKFFDLKKKEGIYKYNVKIKTDEEKDMRERRSNAEDSLRLCLECKGFFSSKYFSRHKCIGGEKVPMKPILIKECSSQMDRDEEFVSILNRFRDGQVGDLCRVQPVIKLVGYRHFCLRRHESGIQDEVRKEVMCEMRTLARLFVEFKDKTPEDVTAYSMFTRDYLPELRDAINRLSSVNDEDISVSPGKDEKHGLKLLIDAVILRSIKSLMGYYSETKQDADYKELKLFRLAYHDRVPEMYSKARYQCRKNSLEKSSHPKNLIKEFELKRKLLPKVKDIKVLPTLCSNSSANNIFIIPPFR